jgi:hypothetical protein
VGVDARAHRPQRLRDALHRPAHERRIADERGIEGLRREQPHHEAHRRAGVAHVERPGCTPQRTGTRAVHVHLGRRRPLDAHPERGERARGCEAIFAVEETANVSLAVRNRSQHEGAVRDRLVAGHREGPGDRTAGSDAPADGGRCPHCTARG